MLNVVTVIEMMSRVLSLFLHLPTYLIKGPIETKCVAKLNM